MRFKIGDMVVPISKSLGVVFERDNIWMKRGGREQGFLYVVGRHNDIYELHNKKESGIGNHYLEVDLIPYQMDENKAFELLVTNKINDKQYEQMTQKSSL